MSHPLAESPSMLYGVAYGGAMEIFGLSICSEVARGIIWRVLRTSIASQPYLYLQIHRGVFSFIGCQQHLASIFNTNR